MAPANQHKDEEHAVTAASDDELDQMERMILEAAADTSRNEQEPCRDQCRYCGDEIVLLPDYDADAPWRWTHAETKDYRCMTFAAPQ
ncbi:hypothetical protein MAHJHV57_46270 [Mycobacterium avium subsp. hominissuis]|nr:hypothetical protein AWC14_00580 [Mycobacterium kyorinense]